jgi:hypothetical protein
MLRCEPGNCAVADVVAAGNLAPGSPSRSRRRIASRFWVLGQFRFPAELHAARAVASFTGAGADQIPLELRQPAQNGQHQAAVCCRRVGPRVAKRTEARFPAGDRRERVQQVAGGSRQPVEPCHHQHVAVFDLVKQAAKLRPVGLGSARYFAKHLARPMLPQRRDLRRGALA